MNNRFSIVKKFPIFAVISLIFIAPGLIGLLTLPFGLNLFNMDVDFVGGTSMTFNIHQEVTSDLSGTVIPELVEEATGVAPSSVQKTGDNGEQVLIKSTKLDNEQQQAVVAAMQEIEYDGVTGHITFDENGDPIKDVAILKLEGGEVSLETKLAAE